MCEPGQGSSRPGQFCHQFADVWVFRQCPLQQTPGAVRFAPNNESQVWQCASKRGTCRRLVQHAACKLLVNNAINNKDLDYGGQTLRENNESISLGLMSRVPGWARRLVAIPRLPRSTDFARFCALDMFVCPRPLAVCRMCARYQVRRRRTESVTRALEWKRLG